MNSEFTCMGALCVGSLTKIYVLHNNNNNNNNNVVFGYSLRDVSVRFTTIDFEIIFKCNMLIIWYLI